MRTRRVGLVGLGLMGGSIGLAMVGCGRFEEVLGYDRAAGVAETARTIGAITRAATELDGLAAADLIVVATPVQAVIPAMRRLVALVHPGTILTDVASTKVEITAAVSSFLPAEVYFVGGHPMAGSERAGLAAADPYLLENAAYVLTTSPPAPAWVHEEVRAVLACTGARFLALSPAEHDLVAAGVSHLPHLAAAALINVAASLEATHSLALTLAGGGFRDTTRIAGGEPGLWTEILMTNRVPLLDVLALFRVELDLFTRALEHGEEETLTGLLDAARRTRETVPARGKGLLGKVEELVVAVQDRPGAIKEVLDILAAEQVNVKDIEILRLREGEGGTLRLAVEDETALNIALGSLATAGLSARRR